MFGLIFWLCVLGILYTYLGYPLLITVLAHTKPKKVFNEPLIMPMVTLLIAAYNEEAVIEGKLTNSLALKYPKDSLQIIVAADGSNDKTSLIVKSFQDQGVELSYIPDREGKMAAINRVMPKVKGEIIVFSDANNVYNENAIIELVKPFIHAAVGAVTGAKVIIKDERTLSNSEGAYWKYESFIKKQESRWGCTIGAAGEIFAIRRHLYIPPPKNIINDDFYIVSRIVQKGYNVIYNPSAQSYELVSATAQDEIERRARITAGRYQTILQAGQLVPFKRPIVAWQMVSHKFLRPLVPFGMIGAGVAVIGAVAFPVSGESNPLLYLAKPFNFVFLLLQLVFYALAILGNNFKIEGKIGKLLYIPTFLVNSNLAALVGLYRYITNRQAHIWQRVQRDHL
jgi:poly-beta-1,6-N-acetyl-D-glucosamine synthase